MLQAADYLAVRTDIAALRTLAVPDAVLAPLDAWLIANAPRPTVYTLPLTLSHLTLNAVQLEPGWRYRRWMVPLIFKGATTSLKIHNTNMVPGGGIPLPLDFPRYEVEIDGKVRGGYTRVAAELSGFATVTLADEPDGLYVFDLYGIAADGSRPLLSSQGCYVRRTTDPWPDKEVWWQNGSRAWEVMAANAQPTTYRRARLPVEVARSNRVQPRVPFLGRKVGTVIALNDLTLEPIVLPRAGVVPAVQRMRNGVLVTEGREFYEKGDTTFPYAIYPLVDGPRGVGTVPIALMLKATRDGGCLFADTWSQGKVYANGTVRRFGGKRHDGDVPHWSECSIKFDGTATLGQWVAGFDGTVRDPALQFVWQCWGMGVVHWTTALDRTAQPVQDATMAKPELPHKIGVRALWSDRHGALVESESSPTDHTTPVKWKPVYPFPDPWGVVTFSRPDLIRFVYVCDRRNDRIVVLDSQANYALVGNFVGTAGLGLGYYVGEKWHANSNTTLAGLQALDCVSPEGAAPFIDAQGQAWVYWGSLAQRDFRRRMVGPDGLGVGPVQVLGHPTIDNNSGFLLVDVTPCDWNSPTGVFFPAGTVWTTSWSVTNRGRPEQFLPPATGLLHTRRDWNGDAGNEQQGVGGHWNSAGYGSALTVGYPGDGTPENPGYGGLFMSSSEGGVEYVRPREPADGPDIDFPRLNRGAASWAARPESLFGSLDVPLPPDLTDDERYAFSVWGVQT